jgi:hypothetical protein
MLVKINNFFKIFLVLTLAVLFVSGFFIFAKKDAVAEGDAIAVRVIANPQHYNPLTWYKNKKFTGNPTPLIVDGYRAIQDGRTVYVNVANVVNGTFYTNIYLISYNQNAGAETMTIFNRILANWKFNTNLTGLGVCFGRPADSKTCTGDSQCPKGLSCVTSVCQQNCLIDSDCAGGGYCNSEKAKVVRDTNRLGDINDLKLTVNAYNSRTGHYPLLTSGTYITGSTVSTWPSWQGEFSAELGSNPPVDSINKLGACSGYDPLTCWDGANKTFAGFLSYQSLSLPPMSSVYVYSTDAQGRNYHACAEMESGYLIGYEDNACPGGPGGNTPPVIDCGTLIGVENQELIGYVSATDADNDPLTFTFSGLPAGINAFDTKDPNKKMITSLTDDQLGKVSYNTLVSYSAALNAVVAYETSPIATLAEISATENLGAAAILAVSSVSNAGLASSLTTRIVNRKVVVDAAKDLIRIANGTAATNACQAAPITTLAEIAVAENSCNNAQSVVDLIVNTTAHDNLTGLINTQKGLIAAAKNALLLANANASLSVCENAIAALGPTPSAASITNAYNLCATAQAVINSLPNSPAKTALATQVATDLSTINKAYVQSTVDDCTNALLGTLAELNAAETLCNSSLNYVNSYVGPEKPGWLLIVNARLALIASKKASLFPAHYFDNMNGLFVDGNYAYVVNWTGNTMEIVDVSNPALPHHSGQIPDGMGGAKLQGPVGVYVVGNYAYVASHVSNALEIVDVSDHANPQHVGFLGGMTGISGVVVSGNYAYVSNWQGNNMSVINIANKSNPVFVNSFPAANAYSISISTSGNYVYLTNRGGASPPYGTDAISIFDISTPGAPVFKSTISNPALGIPLYASYNNNYLFSNNWNDPNGSLQASNVSNPSSPAYAASLGNLGSPFYTVETNGTHAYLPMYDANALYVIDISNPLAMNKVGQIVNGQGGAKLGHPVWVKVIGSYAYVASQSSDALEVVNISDPTNPVHAGFFALNTKSNFKIATAPNIISLTKNIKASQAHCGDLSLDIKKDIKAAVMKKTSSLEEDYKVHIATAVTLAPTNYPFLVTVNDGVNAPVTKTCTINITPNAFVIYPIADQKILVGKTLNFSVYAVSSKKDYSSMNFTFNGLPGFSCKSTSVMKDGRFKCDISFPAAAVWQGKIDVTATNGTDNFTPQSFNLNIYNNPPVMQPIKCPSTIRAGQPLQSCVAEAIDPDGHSISSVNASSLPNNIYLTNFSTDKTCELYFEKIINAIAKKRYEKNQVLGNVTGNFCSDCACRPADPTYNLATCAAHKTSNMAVFGFTPADFGGKSFVFDENEHESSLANCTQDSLTLDGCGGASVPLYACANPVSLSFSGNRGTLQGSTAVSGTFPITFTATDQFGLASNPLLFTLKINTFCGDGVKESPNSEGKGGPNGGVNGDGYEDCDGLSGTPAPNQSTPSWQYGCDDNCTTLSEGYCGDYLVQDGLLGTKGHEVTNDLTIFHTKKNYGELCDFGQDINCCNTCQWVTNNFETIAATGDSSLNSGQSIDLALPAVRGVNGGTFDVTLWPYGGGYGVDAGPTIVFITDISGSLFDPTYSVTAAALDTVVAHLYDQATAQQVNIHVGSLTTHNGVTGEKVDIGNLKGPGGATQENALHLSFGTYSSKGDDPNFASSFTEATAMINAYPNSVADEKYIIFLTDGYPSGAMAEAAAAKAPGVNSIKIYVAAFANWDVGFNTGALNLSTCTANLCNSLRGMCNWSNDNGDLGVCFKNINVDNSTNTGFNGFTYYVGNKSGGGNPCDNDLGTPGCQINNSMCSAGFTCASSDCLCHLNPPDAATVSSRLNFIMDRIVASILSKIPQNITYSIAGGAPVSLGGLSGEHFTVPTSAVTCDISGVNSCSPSILNLKVNFSGSGQIELNNFNLNVLNLCQGE